MTQTTNQSFADDAIVLQLNGDGSAVTVKQTTCYGADGAQLASASPSIQ